MNTCPACGTTYPLAALSCPRCHALTHRARLVELSSQAKVFADAGSADAESKILEQMLELLPSRAAQAQTIQARLAELGKGKPRTRLVGKFAALGALGLVLWKFKALLLLGLTKGKMLLLGLTKTQTLLSMVLSLGLYWSVWGWQFALGFVLSIYVHEMGHVAALRRMGIPATSPMFVPFVGAFVRLKHAPRTVHEDAVVGLAGPISGLLCALACYGVYAATGTSIWGALARSGAWINLFNLVPIWQLDGGRGFNAMARVQQWRMTLLVGLSWLATGEGLLVLLLLGCAYRLFAQPAAQTPNRRSEWTYAALIVALSALSRIRLSELG
ncbi:MAG: site-2 protease family protein [Polyangiaceae bacterium]|nr:site-2 protease family protein [Polyangiaceae bacterium]